MWEPVPLSPRKESVREGETAAGHSSHLQTEKNQNLNVLLEWSRVTVIFVSFDLFLIYK